jgi:hypothetical protein
MNIFFVKDTFSKFISFKINLSTLEPNVLKNEFQQYQFLFFNHQYQDTFQF